MADVGVALRAHGPRCGVQEDAAVGHARGVLDLQPVALRRVDRHPVRGRVHDHRPEPLAHGVDAVGGLVPRLAHRRGHGPHHLAVAGDRDGLGGIVGGGDDRIADGEVPDRVAGLHRHLRVAGPQVLGPPAHLRVAEPVERTRHAVVRGHAHGPLGRGVVGDRLGEVDDDRLRDAHHGPLGGRDLRGREVGGRQRLRAGLADRRAVRALRDGDARLAECIGQALAAGERYVGHLHGRDLHLGQLRRGDLGQCGHLDRARCGFRVRGAACERQAGTQADGRDECRAGAQEAGAKATPAGAVRRGRRGRAGLRAVCGRLRRHRDPPRSVRSRCEYGIASSGSITAALRRTRSPLILPSPDAGRAADPACVEPQQGGSAPPRDVP